MARLDDIELFVWGVETDPTYNGEDVRLLDMVCEDDKGAVVFEFTDPITCLRRRRVWLVYVEGGSITRVVEVDSICDPQSGGTPVELTMADQTDTDPRQGRARGVLQDLYRWWISPGSSPGFGGGLRETATFDSGVSSDDIESFVASAENAAQRPKVRPELVELVCEPDKGTIVFEVTDPAANLRHRVAWFVYLEVGVVTKIIEARCRIENEPGESLPPSGAT